MKIKNLPEDILLEVFLHLPPLYMDFTLPMVRRSYRRLVGANIAKLPKHTVSIHNTISLTDGSRRSRHHIGWFSFGCGREWAGLTVERLENLLVDPRLGRISCVKIRERDPTSKVFVDHLLTAVRKVPVTTVTVVGRFLKHSQRLVENLKPACLELSRDPSGYLPSYASQHYIFHFLLPLGAYLYYSDLLFSTTLNKAGGNKRLVYHFSHICYATRVMDWNNPSKYRCTHAPMRVNEQNAAVRLTMFIIRCFKRLEEGEFHFPEDLLLFCDKDDSTGICKKSMEIEWEKAREKSKPIRLESRIAEEIPGHNYYRRLEGCTWEVHWVSNPNFSSETGGGGGRKHLRVMRKVGGCGHVTLAVHFKVFDKAGKADWEKQN